LFREKEGQVSERLFTGLTPTNTNVAENTPVSLGTTFIPAVNGTVDGQLFRAPDSPTGTYTAKLYQMATSDTEAGAGGTGTLVTGSTQAYGTITASVDNTATYSSPVAVTAGTVYKVVLETSTGHYTATNDFFASADSVSGNLNAPKDTAVKGSFTVFNGTFASGTAYPVGHFRSTLYHITPIFTASGGTTPFTKTAAETYRVLNAWAKTASDAYRVLNAWTKSGSDSYRVLNGWTKAQTETYRVFAIWAKTAAETYLVLNALAKTSPEVYNVLNAWSSTRPETYRVLNALNVTGSDLYRIFNAFTKNVVETYNVLNGTAFSKTAVEAYRVLNAFLKTADETYRVLAPLALSRGETYRVLNALSLTAPESYRVSNSLSLARSESYRVLNSLGLTRPELYNILGASFLVEAPEQYRVFATWLKSAIERYNVGDIAPSTRTISAVANLAPRSVRASLDLQSVVAYLDEVD
jgi:hypothetical protein